MKNFVDSLDVVLQIIKSQIKVIVLKAAVYILLATFLTLHFFALCEIFSQVKGGHGPMVNTL